MSEKMFSMSQYKSLEEMYKDKSDHYQKLYEQQQAMIAELAEALDNVLEIERIPEDDLWEHEGLDEQLDLAEAVLARAKAMKGV